MQNAENPRPVVMWIATPLMILSTYLIFLNLSGQWSIPSIIGISVFILISLGMLISTLFPRKGWWGIRVVSFCIFLAYFSYLITQLLFEANTFDLTVQRYEPSPLNALLGFLLWGVPSLNFSLWGSIWGRAGHKDISNLTFKDLAVYYVMKGAYWLFLILIILASIAIIWKAI